MKTNIYIYTYCVVLEESPRYKMIKHGIGRFFINIYIYIYTYIYIFINKCIYIHIYQYK